MKRNLGIDLFRVLAIFTVVLIHSASTDISYRDGVLRWLPPANACFAFLSGWFLVKGSIKELTYIEIRRLIIKRIKRLLIPYFVWECIYFLLNIGFDILTGKSILLSRWDCLGIVLFGTGSVQMWFVIALAYVEIIFFAILVVMVATGACAFQRGGYFVVLAVVALFFQNGIENTYIRRLVFMFGYGALGVGLRYLAHVLVDVRASSFCFWASLIAAGLVVTSWFFNISESVRCLAWCFVFGNIPIRASMPRWLTDCSAAVMGIYLCHVLFTRVVALGVEDVARIFPNGYAIVLVNAAIGFTASIAFVLLVKRTKYRWVISI